MGWIVTGVVVLLLVGLAVWNARRKRARRPWRYQGEKTEFERNSSLRGGDKTGPPPPPPMTPM